MRKYFVCLTLMSLMTSFGLGKAHALCSLTGPAAIGLFSSLENSRVGSYVFGRSLLDMSASSSSGGEGKETLYYSGCELSAGKFLTLAIAPEEISIRGGGAALNYSGVLGKTSCQFKNSVFAVNETYERRKNDYTKRTDFLRKCVIMTLRDSGGFDLSIPDDSWKQCKATRLSNSSAILEGGVCYVAISPFNNFELELAMNPKCADASYLKNNGITPGQVIAALNSYVSGDASGNSSDLSQFGSTPIELSIDPDSRFMPVSSSENIDERLPRWPSSWNLDLAIGNPTLSSTGSNGAIILDAPLFASNLSTETCDEITSLCWSSQNYAHPLAAEINLYELDPAGDRHLIGNSYKGLIIPPRWQGLVSKGQSNEGLYLDENLKNGETYEYELLFANPYDDFLAFFQSQKSIIGGIGEIDATSYSGQGVGRLSAFAPSRPLIGFRQLPAFGGSKSDQVIDANKILTDSLFRLFALGLQGGWPPYYKSVCDPALKNCTNPNQWKFHTQLVSRFKIDSNGKILPLVNMRKSRVLSEKTWNASGGESMEIECQ